MNNLVLFCKSYRGDLQRAIQLARSIEKYNVDNIPYYFSVPKEDCSEFKKNLPSNALIIPDQEIDEKNEGWLGQQYIKTRFYKLGICDYYVVIDSDSYFNRDFRKSDFMFTNGTPYMVMHENKDLFEWSSRYKKETLGFDPKKSFQEDCDKVRQFLGVLKKNVYFDYGPTPCIWKSYIWEMADDEFTIEKLFNISPTEIKWYGELVHYYGAQYLPREPLFKVMHYRSQYEFYKQLGYKENHFAENYLGMVMQSNWSSPKRY